MLLDVTIKNFALPPMPVDEAAVAAFEQRARQDLMALGCYLKDKDNLLDAAAMQEQLFPAVKPDVFLCHAAGDRQQVMQLAVSLEGFGLEVFVDSCVWGNAYPLLNEIDDHFSRRSDVPGSYRYSKVTRTAASLHMILNAALQRMIDGCELFLHLDTGSVRIEDYVQGGQHIGAPWALSECLFARQVARRGRPRLSLDAFRERNAARPEASSERSVRFRAPGSSHVLEWAVLEREIEDIRGLPSSTRWQEGPWFLDHLYGKLRLSDHEKDLLGWQKAA